LEPIRSRAGTCLLLAALSVPVASCEGDGGDGGSGGDPIGQLFAAARRLTEKTCSCNASSCNADVEYSACLERVYRDHEAEVVPYVDCALDQYAAVERCLDETSCGDDASRACYSAFDSNECAEPPEMTNVVIMEQAQHECSYEIDCNDGTTARGNFCDGELECTDGTDEDAELCEELMEGND
jgi:hypothetical protein